MATTVHTVRWCMTPMITMAASSSGNPKNTSVMRETTASIQPP